jgi:hypothetical protein
MSQYTVSVSWEGTFEADDEGDALIQADSAFSLMSEARVSLDEPDEPDEDDE